MNGNESDLAWNELQQAAQLFHGLAGPPTAPADPQREATALATADKAKNFYTRFPGGTNAVAAMELQCKMLETTYFIKYNTNIFRAWADAQQTMLADPGLSDEKRYDLRLAILRRKVFDQQIDWDAKQVDREKDLRQLIKDYPTEDKPYGMLLNLAANSAPEKARLIASEVLTLPVFPQVKIKAEGVLRRLDAVGKLLEIEFTAFDGAQVDLGRMKGRVVLIDFWATWCGPCVAQIPEVREVHREFHTKGFEVIGISFDSDSDSGELRLRQFIKENDMPWPQYFDGKVWQNKFGIQFGIAAIPQVWIVDKKGRLRDTEGGCDLKGKVSKLLGENVHR